MRSLIISIFLYACESWTLTAELEKSTRAFDDEMLPKVIEHFVQGPCDRWEGSELDPSTHWRIC